MSAIEHGPDLVMAGESRLSFEIDQDAETRHMLRQVLSDDSLELLASFEPHAPQLADLDLQSAKIESLLADRARLLGELQQYSESSDERLERAMEEPAAYLYEVLAGLFVRCRDRAVAGNTMPGITEDWFKTHFSTIRHFRRYDGEIAVKPELYVELTCSIGRPHEDSEAQYRRLAVSTNFHRDPLDQGSTYRFSMVPNTPDLDIARMHFRRGQYLEDKVTDKFERYRLFQALVVDMQSESERLSPEDDESAKQVVHTYIRNEIPFY